MHLVSIVYTLSDHQLDEGPYDPPEYALQVLFTVRAMYNEAMLFDIGDEAQRKLSRIPAGSFLDRRLKTP